MARAVFVISLSVIPSEVIMFTLTLAKATWQGKITSDSRRKNIFFKEITPISQKRKAPALQEPKR